MTREVQEETELRTEVVRMVGTFSDPNRDSGDILLPSFFELRMTGGDLAGDDDAESAEFFPLDHLPPLAFDHATLIRKALPDRPGHSL